MSYNLYGKNFLITGGTGQIGSFLAEALLEEQAHVTLLDLDISGLKEMATYVESGKMEFVECDLTDQRSIESAVPSLSHIQYLVHFASLMAPVYHNVLKNSSYSVELNLKGVIRLLPHFQRLEGICYSSSMAVYGAPAYIPVDEQCPMNPLTHYGCGKFGAEKYLKVFSIVESVPLTILRYASVYGPKNRTKRSVPLFITKALANEPITLFGQGKGFRDFVYISDIIDATMAAIKRNESDDYNIGSGVACTMMELAKLIIKITNSRSKIILSNIPKGFGFLFDISKAKQMLGYTPKVSLEEGLSRAVYWHRNEIDR